MAGPIALIDAIRRVRNMIARATVAAIRQDQKIQRADLRLLADEAARNVEHFQPYGFAHHPLPGAEAVVVFPGGDRGHAIVLVVEDRRYRLHVAAGEVALFDDQGQVVHVKRSGIEIEGQNILLKTSGVLRLDGEHVEIRGGTSLQQEVHGRGQRQSHAGGVNYETDSYQTGAVDAPAVEHGLDQPDLPSAHPSAGA